MKDNETIWKLWRVYGNVSYYVNQYGGIKSYKRGKWHVLVPAKHSPECAERQKRHNTGGPTKYFNLNLVNARKSELFHRVVASMFCQPRDLLCTQVDHIDNNPHNNRADNLEWVTASENMQRRYAQQRLKKEHPEEWERYIFIQQSKFMYYGQ